MKGFSFAALGLCMAYVGMSQNNVGINHTSPRFQLDVVKPNSGATWEPVLLLQHNSTTTNAVSAIQFSNSNLQTNAVVNEGAYVGGIRLGASSQGLVFGTSISASNPPEETMRLVGTGGGRLGIGTSLPTAALHISRTTNDALIRLEDSDGNRRIDLFQSGNIRLHSGTPAVQRIVLLAASDEGRIGIGTSSPVSPLHVIGASSSVSTVLRIDNEDGQRRMAFFKSGNVRFYQGAGNDADEVLSLITNTARSRINVDELRIMGGADVAEYFDVTNSELENIMPGTVLSIDVNAPGKLAISQRAYDKKVAGIISGANGLYPGVMLGQKGTLAHGEHPVAIGGRVYVKADARHQAIEVGDMVTTSSLAGHVMKATDKRRMTGALVGKAMTPLAKGETGLIMILVTLQ